MFFVEFITYENENDGTLGDEHSAYILEDLLSVKNTIIDFIRDRFPDPVDDYERQLCERNILQATTFDRISDIIYFYLDGSDMYSNFSEIQFGERIELMV